PLHPGAVRYYQQVGLIAEGTSDPGALQVNAAAADHSAHANHSGHGDHSAHANHSGGGHPPEHVHDEAMLARARAEVHDGDVILKIGRPDVLSHPETEIHNIYFGLGKTDPAGEDAARVREVKGRIMAVYETYGREPEVYVEGHTDRSGSWEINYEIAHSRARSVEAILIDEGVPESWIHISDYSEEGLAVPTADGVEEERNRRVEITIIPQE
ncbi:MAG: OmpA family protein, partial [Pseudomonadota bacterium]